jgi:phosphoglycolate phosphatase-like HAD superfamily hydrolase
MVTPVVGMIPLLVLGSLDLDTGKATVTWQAFLFDFDGVVLDTTRQKTAIFEEMYADQPPEVIERIVAYHRLHGGISRVVKFRYFEREIFGRDVSEARIRELAFDFAARARVHVMKAPFVPGALQTLERVAALPQPTFVVSGIPQPELDEIIDARDLRRYFTEVHGSPRLKPVIIADLLQRHALEPSRCLFMGDAPTDYRAAREMGLRFLGVEPPGEKHLFPAKTPLVRHVSIPEIDRIPVCR